MVLRGHYHWISVVVQTRDNPIISQTLTTSSWCFSLRTAMYIRMAFPGNYMHWFVKDQSPSFGEEITVKKLAEVDVFEDIYWDEMTRLGWKFSNTMTCNRSLFGDIYRNLMLVITMFYSPLEKQCIYCFCGKATRWVDYSMNKVSGSAERVNNYEISFRQSLLFLEREIQW